SDDLRGAGTGRKLISNAMQFAIEKGYAEIFLTTFEGLKAAQHLYQEVGFSLTNEQRNTTWGNEVTEQRFDWTA
ncbi:MAG: GNAT family N-acetyltransferase, partial [Rhodospirillales bacterium]